MTAKEQINKLQLFCILIQSQIGIAILTLPYDIYQQAQFDGWISVLLAGLFVQVIILLQWFLARKFPSLNYFEIINLLLGNKIGGVVCLSYVIYFIGISAIVLSLYSNIISDWLLPYTPQWITKVLMISIGIYVVKENLRNISRFYVLCSVILLLMLPLIFYSFKEGNILNILPIGIMNYKPILKGTHEAFFSFIGFEILFVIFPFVKASSLSKLKITSFANLFTTIFYTILTLACFLFFSAQELEKIPEPVPYLIKSLRLILLERPDLFFITLWIVVVATSFINNIYSASIGFKNVIKKKDRKIFVYISALCSLIISLIWNLKMEVDHLESIVSNYGLIFILVIPLVLLFLSLVIKKQEAVFHEKK